MRPITLAEKAELETLVDRVGLKSVVTALGDIAHEKSDHIVTDWQDRSLARVWMRVGGTLTKAASSIDV